MADVYVAESGIHGMGVFAARAFAAGETVLVLDDSRVVDEAHPLRPELGEYEYHCDYLEGGKVVLQGEPERHVNSSCDPNAYARRKGGEGVVVARRAIHAGEEITCDYIIDCHGGFVWQCNCGSRRCRRVVPSSFFELPVESQLEYLPLLNEWFVAEHRAEVEALQRLAEGDARAEDDAREG
jgi:SET domain-containing protein